MAVDLFFQHRGRSVATTIPEVRARLGECGEPLPTLPVVAILGDGESPDGLPPGALVLRLPSQEQLVETWLAGGSLAGDGEVPQPVPDTITATQIRLWLLGRGISPAVVDEAVANSGNEGAMIQWEYSPYIERSHPLVEAIAASLGMTPVDVDAAFIEASSL
jgi:hypothetical protein